MFIIPPWQHFLIFAIVGTGPCIAPQISSRGYIAESLILLRVFKVFAVMCPVLTCSDPEGTGAPEKRARRRKWTVLPRVSACPPAKSTSVHERRTGDHRGPHGPSLQKSMFFQGFSRFLTCSVLLCPALSWPFSGNHAFTKVFQGF